MLCPRGFETSRSECGESDLLKIAGVERPRSPIKLKLAPREGTLHPSFIPDGEKPGRKGSMQFVNLNPSPLIVIPAQAGIQLHALRRFKLDPGLRRGDEGGDARIKSGD